MRISVARGRAITIAAAIAVSACATQTLSGRQAGSMSALTLREFLMQRFGTRTTGQSLLASMTNGLSRAMEVTSKYSTRPEDPAELQRQRARREKVRADGSFVFNALYDSTHLDQLLRPANELREFCTAQGGQFQINNPYDPDEIDRVFQARKVAFVTAGAAQDANVKATLGEETRLYTLGAADHAAGLDRDEDRAGAVAGYRAASLRPAFGDATCAGPMPQSTWKVNVRPVYFEPYNPSSSIHMHELDIRIAEGTSPGDDKVRLDTKIEGIR
jgi:hypothetical protein